MVSDLSPQVRRRYARIRARFSIPFWDWTVRDSIPNWLALFTVRGICDLNGKEIRIERARRAASDMAVCRGTLDRLMAHTD